MPITEEITPTFEVDLIPGAPFGTVTLPHTFQPRDLRAVRKAIGPDYELMPMEQYWVRRQQETVLGIRRTGVGPETVSDAVGDRQVSAVRVDQAQLREAGIGYTDLGALALSSELGLREYLREHLADPVAYREADGMLSELLELTELRVGEDITRYAALAAGMTREEFAESFEWAMANLDGPA